ncbi:MAG: DUF4910 domain-containing protein [Candidatus Aminicenantes bacterium]|nr:MAG: DUF4910 domain-containing protein [Candidatus Aminicenantes bacterium]
MNSRTLFCVSCFFLVFLQASLGFQSETPQKPLGHPSERTGLLLTDDATIKLIHNSSGDLAHDYVRQISLWDRAQVTSGYREAAEWVANRAKESGLEKVTIESYPSGKTVKYFENETRSMWTVRRAELWLTSPYKLKLTSYAELPMSVCANSVSANAEAEIVDIGSGMRDEEYGTDVKGKVVLTSSHPEMIVERAVYQKEALGIISYWSVPSVIDLKNRLPGDFPDHVGWARLPVPSEEKSGSFAFMISERRAQELKSLIEAFAAKKPSFIEAFSMDSPPPGSRIDKPVCVRAIVDAEIEPGSLDVVSGVIPGSKYPNEEIIVTAHLCHYKPGSTDNASGSAAILEMARTLNHLIDSRQIPSPLRTIRFLWVPEYSGTYAWFSKHLSDPVQRIANLNFDMPGPDSVKTNAVFSFSYTPDSVPSFLNAIMESILDFMNRYNDERYPVHKDFHIISINGTRNRLQGRMFPFSFGTDHEVFNNLNIPGTHAFGWPDYNYHTSHDTPDKVDPTRLHRSVFSGLAASVMIAYAEDENAEDLAQLSLIYGKKRISKSEIRAADLIRCTTKENFLERWKLAQNIIRHVYNRERKAIESNLVFAKTKKSTRESIQKTAKMLINDERGSIKNLDELADLKTKKLQIKKKKFELNAAERKASRLIPQRKKDKHLLGMTFVAKEIVKDKTFDFKLLMAGLNQAMIALRLEGTDDLRIVSLIDAPAYYADGQRSILDICNAIAADYTPVPAETLLLYFRAFEKIGVMVINEK